MKRKTKDRLLPWLIWPLPIAAGLSMAAGLVAMIVTIFLDSGMWVGLATVTGLGMLAMFFVGMAMSCDRGDC